MTLAFRRLINAFVAKGSPISPPNDWICVRELSDWCCYISCVLYDNCNHQMLINVHPNPSSFLPGHRAQCVLHKLTETTLSLSANWSFESNSLFTMKLQEHVQLFKSFRDWKAENSVCLASIMVNTSPCGGMLLAYLAKKILSNLPKVMDAPFTLQQLLCFSNTNQTN